MTLNVTETDENGDADNRAPPQSLSSRVARGTAWVVAARFFMRAFGFINTIVVARLLVPEDFGLVAIGLTTMQLLQGFSDIGVSQAVVKFRNADRNDMDTLFTLAMFRGLLIMLLLIVAAPFVASFYGDARVAYVFIGVSVFPFLTGLINPKFYEFERDLDFSREFWVLVINKLAGVAVSIIVAVIFRTYWAIVLGLLTNGIVQLVLSYSMRAYRPRISFASVKKVFGFSGWLTGVSFAAALNNKLDSLILARIIGTSEAGNFYIGFQLAGLPTSELAFPMSRALYPGLSELQGSKRKMREAYLAGVSALGAVSLPAAVGFAFVAHELVVLLLGAKWIAAIPVVQHLTPILGIQTLFLATQYYAMAMGMTRLVFFREVIFFLFRTPLIIWATFSFGFMGAIYGVVVTGFVHASLNMALYSRVSGKGFLDPLWAARRSLISALLLAMALLGVVAILPAQTPMVLSLLVKVAIGGAVYLSSHFGLWQIEGRPAGVEKAVLGLVEKARNGRVRALRA